MVETIKVNPQDVIPNMNNLVKVKKHFVDILTGRRYTLEEVDGFILSSTPPQRAMPGETCLPSSIIPRHVEKPLVRGKTPEAQRRVQPEVTGQVTDKIRVLANAAKNTITGGVPTAIKQGHVLSDQPSVSQIQLTKRVEQIAKSMERQNEIMARNAQGIQQTNVEGITRLVENAPIKHTKITTETTHDKSRPGSEGKGLFATLSRLFSGKDITTQSQTILTGEPQLPRRINITGPSYKVPSGHLQQLDTNTIGNGRTESTIHPDGSKTFTASSQGTVIHMESRMGSNGKRVVSGSRMDSQQGGSSDLHFTEIDISPGEFDTGNIHIEY